MFRRLYQTTVQRDPYLLDWGVFDRLGEVIIVYDLKVLDRLSLASSGELHIQRGFSGTFGENCEMCGLPALHSCSETNTTL